MAVRADETGRTRLKDLRQSGATKLVFPRQMTQGMDAIQINTAGGITGGDRYQLNVTVGTGAHLGITTQAAERAYRAQSGEVGRVTTKLTVQSDGRLDWVPQELILFEGSAIQRRLDIDLAPDAQLLMVEALVFGRAAMGETLRNIIFCDRISINRNGRPLYRDGLDLCGDVTALLSRLAVANGAAAMANVVLVRPDAAAVLPIIRSLLPTNAGVSLIADDTLVLRHLAEDSYLLRCDLVPILERLSNRNLPTSWRL